jgi:hypothetical protein
MVFDTSVKSSWTKGTGARRNNSRVGYRSLTRPRLFLAVVLTWRDARGWLIRRSLFMPRNTAYFKLHVHT